MRSTRLHIAIFAIVLVLVGAIGIMTTARKAGDAGSSVAEAESVFSTGEATTEDTATAEAYLAELEQQRELDAYLAELNKIEQEKAAAAQRVATAPKTVAPPDGGWNSTDGSGRWDQLAICESGGNWSYPPVSGGFSGGIMFHIGTWRSNGGEEFAPDAYLATREQQIIVAERVLAGSGWGAWPGCSRKYGWL